MKLIIYSVEICLIFHVLPVETHLREMFSVQCGRYTDLRTSGDGSSTARSAQPRHRSADSENNYQLSGRVIPNITN